MEDGRQLKVLELVHRVVWGPWLLGFFLAAGLWYTLRSGGFQFWGVGIWWKATVGSFFGEKRKGKGKKKRVKEEVIRKGEMLS